MQPGLRTTTLSWGNKGEILGVSLGEEGNEWKAMESLESIVLFMCPFWILLSYSYVQMSEYFGGRNLVTLNFMGLSATKL